MTKQTINLGTMADNKSGDPLRTAFTKINQNFDELYARDGGDFDGSYNSLTDTPTIPTDVNQLADVDGLLNQGGGAANTGDVTFSGVTVIGKSLDQIGSQIYIDANYNGDQTGVNGTGVQVSADTLGIDQVDVGWTITFATGETRTLIASYYWQQGNYWVLQWETTYLSEAPVYPLTVQTADYQAGQPPELILKADDTPDYGVKVFNSIDNDTHLAPLTREKGIAVGFAYGQGSHVRVEGTNGQGGVPNSGDRVAIVASDGDQSSEWTFEKDGQILNNGDNILGTLQFVDNNIIPKTVYPTGTRYSFATNYLDQNLDIDGSTLQFPGSNPFDWIVAGQIIAFADGQTTRTVTDVRWQDGYIMVDFDSPVTLSPAYPLTISDANYDPGVPPQLAIVLGTSQIWFDENGNINIPPNATIQDYYGNDKLAGVGGGGNSGGYQATVYDLNGDWHPNVPNTYSMDDYVYDVLNVSQNGASSDITITLPSNPVHGKMHTIKYSGVSNLSRVCNVTANQNIDAVQQTITIAKDGGYVTFIWDNDWSTWWIISKDLIDSAGSSPKVTNNEFIGDMVELDLTATINKVVPTNSGSPAYHLSDGTEGQIMYIVAGANGETQSEYTSIQIDNVRSSNANGVINQGQGWWWLPFRGAASTSLMLIFTDGAWNVPHNTFD